MNLDGLDPAEFKTTYDWTVFDRLRWETSMLNAAKAYLDAGFSLCVMDNSGPRKGKRPVNELETGEVQADPRDLVLAALETDPTRNLGLITGRGFWVLDVDGNEGDASMDWLAKHIPSTSDVLDRTMVVETTRGYHLYFLHEDSLLHGGSLVPTYAGVLPGVDVRGYGGCVVAPPSQRLHEGPNGYEYSWHNYELNLYPDEVFRPPVEAPSALLELMLCAPLKYEPHSG